jgi:lipase
MENAAYLPEEEYLVSVRGGDLSVFRYGSVSGKPIMALHGTTSSNRAWQWFARTMNSRGYTVYALDTRGRGNSNHLPAPFGLAVHSADLLAVFDYLGIDSCDVVGHSSGAFGAAAFAQLYPDRVSRLVLIDGGIPLPLPAGFTIEQINSFILGPALARLSMTFKSFEAYRDYFVGQPAFVKGWSPALDEYFRYDLRGVAPEFHPSTNKDAVAGDSLDLFNDSQVNQVLKDFASEILMLRAPRGLQNGDALYPEEVLIETLKKFPAVRYVNVEDVNHYDMMTEQSGADKCIELIYGKQV